MLPFSVSLSDASSLAANPTGAASMGGFVFSPTRQIGGTGNRLDNTQSPSTTQSQTPSGGAPAASGVMAGIAASPALPVIIAAAAVLLLTVVVITQTRRK